MTFWCFVENPCDCYYCVSHDVLRCVSMETFEDVFLIMCCAVFLWKRLKNPEDEDEEEDSEGEMYLMVCPVIFACLVFYTAWWQRSRPGSTVTLTSSEISWWWHGMMFQIPPAPNCIKDFLDLPDDSGNSGLTLQLFPMVILVNQVWSYNCFQWKQM